MPRHGPTTWILIGDGAGARIFAVTGEGRRLTLVHEAASETARRKPSEIMSDRAGRMPDPGSPGQRSAMQLPTDPQRHAKEMLAREVAGWLGDAVRDGRVERLVLVAAPQALGDLRAHLPAAAAAIVVKEIDRNLAPLDGPALEARLDELLP